MSAPLRPIVVVLLTDLANVTGALTGLERPVHAYGERAGQPFGDAEAALLETATPSEKRAAIEIMTVDVELEKLVRAEGLR